MTNGSRRSDETVLGRSRSGRVRSSARLIVTAEDLNTALARTRQAVCEIDGVTTNLPFLATLLGDHRVAAPAA
jgi:acetyl/propionyl-CoA carboxylase alpha subunit